MNMLLHAFQAERIKVRRTFLAKSPILFPFLVPLFPFLALVAGPLDRVDAAGPGGASGSFAAGCFAGWLYTLLPLYALLVALMSFHAEHTQGTWKHLNALPAPGPTQVLAKQLMGAWQLLLGNLSLAAQVLLALGLLMLIRPGLGFRLDNLAFWGLLLKHALLGFVAGLMILAPLQVVAGRFRNIGVTLTTGIFGMTMSFFLKPTDTAAAFFPWTMGKVWLMNLMDPVGARHLWWIAPAVLVVIGSYAVHAGLQRRKPLY